MMKNPSAEYYLFDISIYAYSSLYLVLLHLFNLKPLALAAAEKAAPSHLDLGVQFLARGQISEALQQFHSAIEENPNDFMSHYRRATAYLALGKGKAALDDLDAVLTLRPDFQAARTQRVSILTKYGRFDDALTELGTIKDGGGKAGSEEEVMPKINELTKLKGAAVEAQELMDHDEDYEGALNLLNGLIESCPWNSDFRKLRSEALIATGDLSQAVFDLKQLTKLINDNTEGFLKLSLLYYQMADDEQSLAEIRECLKLDPDHKACFSHYKKVKKLNKQLNEAQELINESKFAECIPKLNSALKTEPDVEAFKTKVAPKKCKCMSKSNQAKSAIKVCTEGLESLPDDEEMLVDRAEAYLAEEEYDKAIQDYETALKNNEESRRLNDGLKRAKKLLKQSQKRDYYKILGLKRTATKQEINKAYRKLAQQYHPDRYEGGDKEDAEKKFMDIAAAKEVLSDPEKRQQFDNGDDPLDPEEQSRQGGQGHPFHGGFPFKFQGGNFQFKFKF